MKLVVPTIFLALALSAWAAKYPAFDRCDPHWVKTVQYGALYDCSDPTKKNAEMALSSSIVSFANVLSSWGRNINGKPINPGNLMDYYEHMAQTSKDENALYSSLGIKIKNYESPTKEQVQEFVNELRQPGWAVIVQSHVNREYAVALRFNGEAFEVLDSRGKTKIVDVPHIEHVVSVQSTQQEVIFLYIFEIWCTFEVMFDDRIYEYILFPFDEAIRERLRFFYN
eukprot:TRINITY_DN6411_c0_g1_i4.p1 TRINITY_DN6411_c0_g1~~TRINITY_DN6411_c0_g1_i4.p1  ORF type:complete len:226 (-),score=45.97 TRINITY_DN6411_c0_g1_i4:163-840(-)